MKKILVVDDTEVMREFILVILNEYIHEAVVFTAADGKEGWKKFQEFQPHLVITDLQMESKLAGLELARKIKNLSDVPVILATAHLGDEASDFIDALLEKPFNIRLFVETVKEYLKKVSERR